MTIRSKYCLPVVLLLLLWLPGGVIAKTVILTDELAGQQEPLHLLDYADILEDPDGGLTLQNILAGERIFQPPQTLDGKLDLFLTRSVYWLRVDMLNQSGNNDWYFSLSGSLSRKVAIYLDTDGDGQALVQQHLMPNAHANQYFLQLPTDSRHRLYIRVQDHQAPLVIEPHLYSSRQMLTEIMVTYPLLSFVIGGLLTLSLYNLLYFFYLRDRGFLALSIFVLGFVLEIGNHSGVWHYFGWFSQYLSMVGNAFAFMAIAASISLAANWLEMRQYLPRFYRLFRLGFWASCLLIPLHWWLGYGTVFAGATALLMIIPSAVVVVLRSRQGFHFPFMSRASMLLVLLGFIPTLLRGAGLIGDVPMLTDSMYFVLLLALIMLSLTQAEQVHMKSEQARRIAATNQAKDEFLTTMSHELRTPMNAVVNAGRLLGQTSLSATQNEYVARLGASAKHMLALIDDILDLARLDSSLLRLEETPFQLEEVLHQLELLLVGQAHSKGLKLVMDNRFHSPIKQLSGDPIRLRQVLLNLLNNAITFTPQGKVSLTVTPLEITRHNARLLFEVRDTGIGISGQDQQKLFQPFAQVSCGTARQYGGSGLGLAISQKLVQCMGGELQVESWPQHGSCFFFTLTLPLQEPQPTQQAVETTLLSSLLPDNLRILLVDDDEMNRFFGGELIRSLGVIVDTADSGLIAIQLLQAQDFDLVFMDVGMPDMDGYVTTRQIRACTRFANLPVIALTAHVVTGERERCLAAGMNDYLTKPFEIEKLEMAIRRWGRKAISR